MPTLGTTLFSLTPAWRSGAGTTSLLDQLAAAGCGPAVEVIGHQAWRGFPASSPEDERAFRDAVDRLGLQPAALGVYTDLFRHRGRPMTTDEAVADLLPQLGAAVRLGFPVVRATLGMEPEMLRRAATEAERLGVVLTFELQGATLPDAPAVQDVLELQAASGTPFLGFTLDTSLTTPALPRALDTALSRRGLDVDGVRAVHAAWAADGPVGTRIGRALAVVTGLPLEVELATLVAGVLGRCGRTTPHDWAPVLPVVRHAHAKFWDPDVETVRAPHGAWLAALTGAGYDGAFLSEWGGHELLDRHDADGLTVTRAHHELLAQLLVEQTGVPA